MATITHSRLTPRKGPRWGNPIVYLINAFRWTFYGESDVSVELSVGMTLAFFVACLAAIAWIFRTGYRLKN